MPTKALKSKKPVKKAAVEKPKAKAKAPVAAAKTAVKGAKAARSASASAPPPSNAGPAAVLKHVYKRWHDTKGGNAAEFIALLAEDATWGSIANGTLGIEFARELLSRNNVQNYFERFAKDWEVVFCRIERVITEGSTVVVLSEASWKHKRTGKAFMTPKADVWEFKRGKAISFFEYFDTATVVRNAL
ncbi:MAG: nuclear transport factor 2 family protein [Aestuariivirgaceae bacterium]|nr:nuclear transport factor 2 family protein [Aestuariivirgaceae bacterium]